MLTEWLATWSSQPTGRKHTKHRDTNKTRLGEVNNKAGSEWESNERPCFMPLTIPNQGQDMNQQKIVGLQTQQAPQE